MKKRFFFFIISLWMSLQLYAQIDVRGIVISEEDNEPVIGASIVIKGSSEGTVTGLDGDFIVKVKSLDQLLVVSYVGMQTREVKARDAALIKLSSSSESLDEVIVVAYGTAKKSSFTGSVGNMGKEKISKLQVSDVSKALEGAVAGVQITSASGQPGSSASIRVRGIGSLSSSSSPLIVVDGVPYEGSLNTINPSDIENMSVLKDAAANSLYGARGANGVIMITTRKGTQGKVRVQFENRTGLNFKGIRSYDILTDAGEYYELFWEAMRNQQVYAAGKDLYSAGLYASSDLVNTLGNYNSFNVANEALVNPITGLLNPDAQLLYQDNWLDEAFSPGFRQENNLSIAGGNEQAQYYVSLGYLNDNSYTVQSNLVRYSGRVKLDLQLNKWLKVGVNMAAQVSSTNIPGSGSSSDIFYQGQNMAPIYPVYRRDAAGNYMLDADGKRLYDYGIADGKSRPFAGATNAIDQQANNIREGHKDVLSAKLYLQANITKQLRYTVNFSADRFNNNSIDFATPIGGDAQNVNGRSTKSFTNTGIINANHLLNWEYSVGKHNWEAMLGNEIKQDKVTYMSGTKVNFYLADNPELDNAVVMQELSSASNSYGLLGVFSQLKYNFNDRYYLSGSYRVDGSSRYHPDCRWGNFWSVGGAWRINQEAFMRGYAFIDDLKLKGSFGTQGNDNLGNLIPYKSQYVVSPQDGEASTNIVFRGNPNITWEKSNNFNVGFDFRFWQRLSGQVEYFSKTTWDMLYAMTLPPSMGSPNVIWQNTMRMRNTGFELELKYDLFSTRDFFWNLSLNMTHYRNKLLELPSDRPQTGWARGDKFLRKGASIYNWYGFKYAGVDAENGSPLYYADELDAAGNVIGKKTVSKTEEATMYEYGKSSIPDLYGGIFTELSYKGFDMNLSFAYQVGGWVDDAQYSGLMHGGNAGTNWHKDIYKRWTPGNTNTDVPRLQTSNMDINATSDRFLTNASYLSLRNVTLGYSLQGAWMKRASIERMRIYLSGDNLFLLSARRGFDPRQSFSGNTGYNYSALGTTSLGLNIQF